MRRVLLSAALAAGLAAAAGTPDERGVSATVADYDGSWALFHLAEEHQISNFDAGAFFTLHDFSGTNTWSPEDVRRLYGLEDRTAAHVPATKREEVTRDVFALFDVNHDGTIERDEFLHRTSEGVKLPDFGLGPGHHGDEELEYEIHHFEKYHDENTKLEDLTHPEDIAHFAMHEHEEEEAERIEKQNEKAVIEANIPNKFRRKPWMEL